MIATNEADQLALDLDPIRSEDAGLIGWVRGLQGDGGTLAAEALQGGFFIIHQCDDDIAGVGRAAVADDDSVTIEDASLIESPLTSSA